MWNAYCNTTIYFRKWLPTRFTPRIAHSFVRPRHCPRLRLACHSSVYAFVIPFTMEENNRFPSRAPLIAISPAVNAVRPSIKSKNASGTEGDQPSVSGSSISVSINGVDVGDGDSDSGEPRRPEATSAGNSLSRPRKLYSPSLLESTMRGYTVPFSVVVSGHSYTDEA